MPLVADSAQIAEGFCCYTTDRNFDNDLRTPWQVAGERILSLSQERGFAFQRIAFASQVHGNVVRSVTDDDRRILQLPQCDGLVVQGVDVALAIRTADCVPVVLVDEEAKVCGNFHAGWRGTMGRIVEEGILAMEKLGAKRSRICGWIGPAISGKVYEVSSDLAAEFLLAFPSDGDCIAGRYVNLPELNRRQAIRLGAIDKNVSDSGSCTYSNPALFYSHRRHGIKRGHQFTICGFFQ